MKSLVKLLLFLMLIVIPFSESKTSVYKFQNEDIQCSNDSICPTWFICNANKKCQCDDRHTDKILCNDRAHTSAVLNCNCVTYNKDKRSTYVGGCFYNCQSFKFQLDQQFGLFDNYLVALIAKLAKMGGV